MSSSPISNLLTGLLFGAVLLAAGLAGVAGANYLSHNGREVITALRIERRISPASPAAELALARAELDYGRSARGLDAARRAQRLVPTDPTAIELVGVGLLLNGDQPGFTAWLVRQTDPAARQRLTELSGAQTAQAQALYVLGLPRASQRLLVNDHDGSSTAELLRARLALALQPGRGGQQAALGYLNQALAIDPANVSALEQLVTVSQQIGYANQANDARQRLRAIRSGHPGS